MTAPPRFCVCTWPVVNSSAPIPAARRDVQDLRVVGRYGSSSGTRSSARSLPWFDLPPIGSNPAALSDGLLCPWRPAERPVAREVRSAMFSRSRRSVFREDFSANERRRVPAREPSAKSNSIRSTRPPSARSTAEAAVPASRVRAYRTPSCSGVGDSAAVGASGQLDLGGGRSVLRVPSVAGALTRPRRMTFLTRPVADDPPGSRTPPAAVRRTLIKPRSRPGGDNHHNTPTTQRDQGRTATITPFAPAGRWRSGR